MDQFKKNYLKIKTTYESFINKTKKTFFFRKKNQKIKIVLTNTIENTPGLYFIINLLNYFFLFA